ncbi:MAG: DegT/DnrJ/EryC1/StrS family aminotransferase [Cytophagaceae bacterium]|jgi:dTDP-4-amino-4,6-dideoxygalactose transaminase|nr:DegT/DnrJ/EryC1/StrS family aminotransferase [Cytophagaceae bacterium]
MNTIQMVDLLGQYKRIKNEIDAALIHSIESSAFIQGPPVKELEAQLASYLNSASVIGCANGTDALQVAMMALALKPGDEIIVPAFTYIATVETAALLGLKLILAESDPHTFNISPASVEASITERTKAIVVVHLFGQCCAMEALMKISNQYGIPLIEDNAQAIGAFCQVEGMRKHAGTIGAIGTTSFFPSKNLGCYGDGGALFSQDATLAKQIRMICNHGQERKYYHDIIGVNSRLDTLQASILLVKLKHLDAYIAARQKAADFYDAQLSGIGGIQIPYRDPASSHVFHQYTLKVADGKRDALKSFLEKKGIPTMVYYPEPVHFQKAYASVEYPPGSLPVAELLARQVLSLPMHTELEESQQSYICQSIREFFA